MSRMFKHLRIYRDQGRADPRDIDLFEKKNNICLPGTYKSLMLAHNGARFEESYFDFINKNQENDIREVGFDYFGAVEHQSDLNIDHYNSHIQDPLYYGVPGLIAIGSTAQGDTLCFDYRDDPKTCEPKVVLLVHDEYEEEPDGTVHMKIEPIADNFDAFLDLLYAYRDDEE